MRPVLDAFERVGTSEPVTLSRKEKGDLLGVIEFWVTQVPGGYTEMPEGIFDRGTPCTTTSTTRPARWIEFVTALREAVRSRLPIQTR